MYRKYIVNVYIYIYIYKRQEKLSFEAILLTRRTDEDLLRAMAALLL